MEVIAAYSVKGGVGKTTAAVNLAWCAAAAGKRVLLWDLDPQGSATWLLQAKPKIKGGVDDLLHGDTKVTKSIRPTAIPGIAVLPADEGTWDLDLLVDSVKKPEQRLSKILQNLSTDTDVVILDAPPGASALGRSVLRAADVIVVPLHPSALSLRALAQVEDVVADVKKAPRILGFFSLVDRRRTAHRDAVADLPHQDRNILPIVVPASVIVERMGQRREPVGAFAPTSEPARAFEHLWQAADEAARA